MMTRSDGIRTVSMVAATSIAVQGGLGSEPAMATSGQVDIRFIVRTGAGSAFIITHQASNAYPYPGSPTRGE